MIRRIAIALLIAVLVYLIYLGGRIMVERRSVSARVDAIIAAADPADVTLSPARAAMLLRVQDPTFLTNKGVDFSTPGAGMTTLSQSLGKRIFFDRFKPGLAKGELIALTRFALYPTVDKRRTLKAFLATAYFGRRAGRAVIGFGPAARAWFGRCPWSRCWSRRRRSIPSATPPPMPSGSCASRDCSPVGAARRGCAT